MAIKTSGAVHASLHICILLLVSTIIISGCDSTAMIDEPTLPEDASTDKVDELRTTHMPNGSSLLSPREFEEAKRVGVSGEVSPYACYLSAYDADAAYDYQFHSRYLHFPQEMVEASGGEVRRVAHFISDQETGTTRRFAHCFIPDAPGAEEMLNEFLLVPDSSEEKAYGAGPATAKEGCDGGESAIFAEHMYFANGVYHLDAIVICVYGGGSGGGGTFPNWGANTPYYLPDDPAFSDGGGGDSGGGGSFNNICDSSQLQMPGDDDCPVPAEPDFMTTEETLLLLLQQSPHILLDIPCDEIPNWQAVAGEEVPQSVLDRLNTEPALQNQHIFDNDAFMQRLNMGTGTTINQDYFSVNVDESNLPGGMSPEAYLEQIRTNLNDYIDTSISEFEGYRGIPGEWDRWTSSNSTGSVLSIAFGFPWHGFEHGSVVSIANESDRWVFGTAWTPADGYHPVSGNREFGFTRNGSQITFYTRGVDRLSTGFDSIFGAVSQGLPFNEADELWSSLMEGIRSDLQQENGGQDVATVADMITYRPDWNEIAKLYDDNLDNDAAVLNGLGCNN